jgi:quercetin dioxygenase-like cupin family protein
MAIEQIFGDAYRTILKATIPAGTSVPPHCATSDAFLIVSRGTAVLDFQVRQVTLTEGTTFLIPESREHALQVLDDFEAYIVLAGGGKISWKHPEHEEKLGKKSILASS